MVDDHTTLLAFKFVFGQVDNICRLCLSPNENKTIKLDEKVNLQTFYHNETISYATMLDNLEVPKEHEMPQVLCKNCANMTINCYLFQKLRQFSSEKWLKILQLLKISLSHLDDLKANTNSVYLIVNKSENIVLKSNKSYGEKPNKVVVLNDFMKSCQRYLNDEKDKKSKDYVCGKHDESLDSQYFLQKHMQFKHYTIDNPCNDNPITFSIQNYSENKHYSKKSFSKNCNIVRKDVLNQHIKTKHVSYSCKLCDTIFLSHEKLLKHIKKHKIRTCPTCKKKYENIHFYQIHIKRCGIQKDIQEQYICDYCNKCYKRKNGIRSHLKIDHGFGDVLACNWCFKKFDAVSRLRNHTVKHTKEKNFYCNICKKEFVTHTALVYHTRLHTGEKPFPCDLCDKSFLSASRRMEHKKRKHIGPTKECTLCDMKFITTFQLRKHFHRHFNPSSKLFITKDDLIELKRRGKVK